MSSSDFNDTESCTTSTSSSSTSSTSNPMSASNMFSSGMIRTASTNIGQAHLYADAEKVCETRFLHPKEAPVFEFGIRYLCDTKVLEINCTHLEEHYEWRKEVDKDIVPEKQNILNITLTPRLLYSLLEKFAAGKLDPMFKFSFPKSMKAPDSDLPIKLKTTVAGLAEDPDKPAQSDIKFLCLTPVKIDDATRTNKKLDEGNKIVRNRLCSLEQRQSQLEETTQKLETSINSLASAGINGGNSDIVFVSRIEFDNLMKEFEQFKANYVPRSELEQLKATYATKQDFSALLTNDKASNTYATKEDLKSLATKDEASKLVPKEEMDKFGTSMELKFLTFNNDVKQCANDIKQCAAKKDIEGFVNKDALNAYATKEELGKLATKEELGNYALKTA